MDSHQKQGPVSYIVDTDKGLWKRHVEQLQKRLATAPQLSGQSTDGEPDLDVETTEVTPGTLPPPPVTPRNSLPPAPPPEPDPAPARYPGRNRQPPDYYGH